MGAQGSKKKLSKDDMQFLKSHTTFDEETITKWHEGFKTDCPTGKLTPSKFEEMYKLFFPTGNATEFCSHCFRVFDSDGNGYIDFKEFLLAIDVTSTGSPEAKLKWAFKMYDVDGNGVIDLEEMTKIVQSIYNMMRSNAGDSDIAGTAAERANDIFVKMDTDGDGSITQEEFLGGCLEDKHLTKLLAPNVG